MCDEPTSSLDGETELEIMNNLKAIGSDRTTIIIAHRLSTVQDCDKIFVMDKGIVVEEGTHEELLERNGRYTELLKMQEWSDVVEEDTPEELLQRNGRYAEILKIKEGTDDSTPAM